MQRARLRQIGAAAAAVLTPSLLFVSSLLLLAGPAEPGVTDVDPQCRHADRAAASRIRSLLDQADSPSTRALERAVFSLSTARSHCSYGWVELALRDYAELQRALPQ